MARGKTLEKLLDELRAEARLSLNPALNKQTRDHHVNLLQRHQERLWDDFDWPHLRIEANQPCQAGSYVIEPPDNMLIERLEEVYFRDGDSWCKLRYGIGPREYNIWDSEQDQRSWPVERWQIRADGQIEVWPIPGNDADAADVSLNGWFKFVGIRNLQPLVDDSDRADIDDRTLVLYAAAELLAAAGAKDAPLKQAAADKRYARLRGQLLPRRKFSLFNRNAPGKRLHGPPRVSYRVVS